MALRRLFVISLIVHGAFAIDTPVIGSMIKAGAAALLGRKSLVGRGPVLSTVVFSPEEDATGAGSSRVLEHDVDLASSPRLELAHADSPSAYPWIQSLSCAKPGAASEPTQCPDFRACSVSPAERAGPLPAAAGSFPVSACFAGQSQAEPALVVSSPPLNCDAWYLIMDEERAQMLAPYRLHAGEAEHGSVDEVDAVIRLLAQKPALGCAHPEDFSPQRPRGSAVYQIREAFVSSDAAVFSTSAVFQRPGCRPGAKCSPATKFAAGAVRVEFADSAVNLVDLEGHTWQHWLVSALPAFRALGPIMAKAKDTPVLGLQGQFETYQRVLGPLVGVPAEGLNSHVVTEGQLFHAGTLFQPSLQTCGHYSRSVWTEMRSSHLLHPEGLPLFNSDWSLRATSPLSDEEMARIAEDWVVVIARRPGRKALLSMEEIQVAVERELPPQRVVVYSGNLPILETRALFRRARLLIGEPGEALANMVFMASQASILEVRPDSFRRACYHKLADACSLKYNLVMAKGSRPDSFAASEVARLAREITIDS